MHFLKTLTAIVFGHIKENLKSFRATMKSVVFFCVFDSLLTFKLSKKGYNSIKGQKRSKEALIWILIQ